MDDNGIPIIADTDMKVIELVLSHKAHGWSTEELRFQYPFLSVAQIEAALHYYAVHRDVLDQQIKESLDYVQQMRQRLPVSPLIERLCRENRADVA